MARTATPPKPNNVLSPDAALARLTEGNARYVAGVARRHDFADERSALVAGQNPYAAVLGCADSRVVPEYAFDCARGDLFVTRVAGNFVNVDILGSLEYATEVAGAKAIVVLGHNSCGAIKSAVDGVQMGNITALLDNFGPALAEIGQSDGPRDSNNDKLVQKVAEANARLTAESLTSRSPIMQRLVESGNLTIAAAMHDITTGRVSWLS